MIVYPANSKYGFQEVLNQTLFFLGLHVLCLLETDLLINSQDQ
jgi:hypothetical protein